MYLNHADKFNVKEAFILRAKLVSLEGKHDVGIALLKRGVATHFPQEAAWKELKNDHQFKEERILCAQVSAHQR